MLSKENLIGPNRARRAHNAIFVSFEDKTVPTEPLEAAKINWQKNGMHPSDIKAEEEMRKVSSNTHIAYTYIYIYTYIN